MLTAGAKQHQIAEASHASEIQAEKHWASCRAASMRPTRGITAT